MIGYIHYSFYLGWTCSLQFFTWTNVDGYRPRCFIRCFLIRTRFHDISANQFFHLERLLATLQMREIYRPGDSIRAALHASFVNFTKQVDGVVITTNLTRDDSEIWQALYIALSFPLLFFFFYVLITSLKFSLYSSTKVSTYYERV